MTAETIHTCSYSCERPECVRRQRDELRDRMEAVLAQRPAAPSGEVVAWFPTNAQGEIIRNYGDGSPVYACRTKEEAEQAKRCHLGATSPVIPLYAAKQPAAVDEAVAVLTELVATLAATGTVTGSRIYFPERQTRELLKKACDALAAQQQGGVE